MQKVIIITLENKSGVLNRVTSLLRRRNFNIDSLTVGRMADPRFSRITLVLEGNTNPEQVSKQLHKLINVLKVWNLDIVDALVKESLFLKISLTASTRSDILKIAEMFGAHIENSTDKVFTLFITDTPEKIENAIQAFKPFGIKELVRSGAIAMAK